MKPALVSWGEQDWACNCEAYYERHRGRLQIISKGDGENVFTVYFPIIGV